MADCRLTHPSWVRRQPTFVAFDCGVFKSSTSLVSCRHSLAVDWLFGFLWPLAFAQAHAWAAAVLVDELDPGRL